MPLYTLGVAIVWLSCGVLGIYLVRKPMTKRDPLAVFPSTAGAFAILTCLGLVTLLWAFMLRCESKRPRREP
jgi:hypothetical protein